MEKDKKQNRAQDRDPHLDIPAEANRDKHHNYLADNDEPAQDDGKLTERQKQWKKGLEEGRAAQKNNET